MDSARPGIVTRRAGHPLLAILASFPIAGFCGALATDIVYAFTANMMWADFSAWLLAGGIAMGALAAIAGLVDMVSAHRAGRRPAWGIAAGSLLVLILALFDNLVHSRDAWTSVVPGGLVLSAIVVVVMLITAWAGFAAMAGHPVNVQPAGARS